MASKFPANSSEEKQGAVKSTSSRKTIRRTTAALALKADDGDDDDRSRRKRRSSASKDASEGVTAQDSDGDPGQVDRAEAAADRAEVEADRAQAEADRAEAEADRVGIETAHAPEAGQAGDAEATLALPDTGGAAKQAEPEARAESQGSSLSAAAPAAAPAEPVRTEQPVYATLLPPHAIGTWPPDSPAPPPGRVPSGDSRSLRRFHQGVQEFVLIYRYDSFLIKRAGIVGQQGTWTVVEYPHIGAAAHAYAQECSTLTGAGYYDLR